MSPARCTVSAPGKVILFGEHAVVFGKTAIAGCVAERTTITFQTSNDDRIRLQCDAMQIDYTCSVEDLSNEASVSANDDRPDEIFARFGHLANVAFEDAPRFTAISMFLHLQSTLMKDHKAVAFHGLHACVSTQLAVGAGLGSSAAYSVCIATGLAIILGLVNFEDVAKMDPHALALIEHWALMADSLAHERPSGIDTYTIIHGGLISFSGTKRSHLPLPKNLHAMIVDTHTQRNTKTLVQRVGQLVVANPSLYNSIMDEIGQISNEFISFLAQAGAVSDEVFFATTSNLVRRNRHLLELLEVGHDRIKHVYQLADQFNMPSKLTGAGGGGCVLVLVPPNMTAADTSAFFEGIRTSCMSIYHVVFNSRGVRVDNILNVAS